MPKIQSEDGKAIVGKVAHPLQNRAFEGKGFFRKFVLAAAVVALAVAVLISGLGGQSLAQPTGQVTSQGTAFISSGGMAHAKGGGVITGSIGIINGKPATVDEGTTTITSTSNQTAPAPQQPQIDALKEKIKQNPNQAALYIQLADEQIKNNAPPQEIINTLEAALKQKNLQGTDKEKATIHNALGIQYRKLGRYKTAKEYIDAGDIAYKQKKYSQVISLSEEAQRRIDEGTLSATDYEYRVIKRIGVIGRDLLNR